ncbi:MAG: hypothetical protein ACMXYA_02640 [Candidatus Woesearchaeota archaeon]
MKKKYIYLPKTQYQYWQMYATEFPELFSLGDTGQRITEVFWGQETINEKKIDFVTGIFHYGIRRGTGKNRRTDYYQNHFFILHFPKKIPVRFSLIEKKFLQHKIPGFSVRKLTTESFEFNKKFLISYKDTSSENEVSIMSSLTPKVQEEFLGLAQKKKSLRCAITPHAFAITAEGYVLRRLKTNFAKDTTIREEDVQIFSQEIQNLQKTLHEITRYW